MYYYNYNYAFSRRQTQIARNHNYNNSNGYIITRIVIYVQTDATGSSEVNLVQGGVGESSVTFDIVAKNSSILRFRILVFGRRP